MKYYLIVSISRVYAYILLILTHWVGNFRQVWMGIFFQSVVKGRGVMSNGQTHYFSSYWIRFFFAISKMFHIQVLYKCCLAMNKNSNVIVIRFLIQYNIFLQIYLENLMFPTTSELSRMLSSSAGIRKGEMQLTKLAMAGEPESKTSSGFTLSLHPLVKDSLGSFIHSPSGEQWISKEIPFSQALITRCTSISWKASEKSAKEKVPSCKMKIYRLIESASQS